MMKRIIGLLSLVCCYGLTMQTVMAANALDSDRVTFRGFGTLGISCFTADSYDFYRDLLPNGPGKSRRCDTKLDTLLGLQVDAKLSERIVGTVQATSYHRADDTFRPDLTLANIRTEIGESNTLRIGRMQNPFFLVSEFRNVLYAQPWARPPVDMYGLVEAYSIDGAEIGRRLQLNDYAMTLLGGLASSSFDVSRFDGTGMTDKGTLKFGYLNALMESGDWHLKGSLVGGKTSYTNPQIESALSNLVSLGASGLASSLAMNDKRFSIFSLGGSYETNLWHVQGEYVFRTIDSFFRDKQAAYMMAGRHLGNWMPYTIVSTRWSKTQGKENQTTDPTQHAIAKGLVDFTNDDNRSFILGLSFKLNQNATLKGQVNFTKPGVGTGRPTNTEHLTTLNLDFVF